MLKRDARVQDVAAQHCLGGPTLPKILYIQMRSFSPIGMAQEAAPDYSKLTIVLPTYNEVENISNIVPELFRLYPGVHVTVVDDSSSDGTGEAVEGLRATHQNLKLIERHISKKGLTASVMEGIASVQTEYFVAMDADFQHPPASVADLYGELMKGADVAIGVRRDMGTLPLYRRAASWGAHKLAASYLWCRRQPRSRDLMSGFFGGRTEIAKNILRNKGDKFEPKGFKVLFDLLKFVPRDSKVAEASFTFGDRVSGNSKLNSDIILSLLKQCGSLGKVASFTVEFFFINKAGRVVGLLILVAIIAIALMMGGQPAKP